MSDERNRDMDQGSRGMDSQERKEGDDRMPGRGGRGKVFFKKKVCKFCTQKLKIDYKDFVFHGTATTERGKILPRRITGTCLKHQKMLSAAIKRARVLSLVY